MAMVENEVTTEDKSKTSKRPKNTQFKQQRLWAWQPVMSANSVLPMLFAIGIAFIPLGVGFLITANNVQERIIDYTAISHSCNCSSATDALNATSQSLANSVTSSSVQNYSAAPCVCDMVFTLHEDFRASVYMYYSLTNFYQNHRRYIKSVDQYQLNGASLTYTPTTDCAPLDTLNKKSYAPCGYIANSMFNDSLWLTYWNGSMDNPVLVPLLKTNIAWPSDKSSKYANPGSSNANLSTAFNGTLQPPNWSKPVYELDSINQDNNGYKNEDLMVWMRAAAFPTFRKLYRRVDHTAGSAFKNGLPAGNYTLHVMNNYPVFQFHGAKRVILSTTSFLGGKNPFLGIAYLVVGTTCIISGLIFLVIHLQVGRSPASLDEDITSQTLY